MQVIFAEESGPRVESTVRSRPLAAAESRRAPHPPFIRTRISYIRRNLRLGRAARPRRQRSRPVCAGSAQRLFRHPRETRAVLAPRRNYRARGPSIAGSARVGIRGFIAESARGGDNSAAALRNCLAPGRSERAARPPISLARRSPI